MDITDFGWEHQPPEYDTGDYWFDGQFFITKRVKEEIPSIEITMIYAHIKNLVQQKKGIDYLHVFLQKERDIKLFFIDQVTRQSLQSGEQPPEHHYCTLLFAEEY